jgi:hypothetical protein
MSKFDELTNVTRKNLFTYQPEGELPFIKIKELREKSGDGPYVIKALWIASRNSAEAHPIITIEGYNVSIPAYKLQDVENMLQDDPTIEQINKGACGFVIADYENKFGKQVGIRWIKLDEPFEV